MTGASACTIFQGSRRRDLEQVYVVWFLIAFLAAPCVVAIFGFWAIVPVFALIYGAPFWVLLGGPCLWIGVRRGLTRATDFAALGFVANFATPILVAIGAWWSGAPDIDGLVTFYFGFGAVMAPLWGAVFGLLYRP